MILVAYRHGLRASEVCDLRYSTTSGTRTSSTRSDTPKRGPTGLRTFGGDIVRSARDRSRKTMSGPPHGPARVGPKPSLQLLHDAVIDLVPEQAQICFEDHALLDFGLWRLSSAPRVCPPPLRWPSLACCDALASRPSRFASRADLASRCSSFACCVDLPSTRPGFACCADFAATRSAFACRPDFSAARVVAARARRFVRWRAAASTVGSTSSA